MATIPASSNPLRAMLGRRRRDLAWMWGLRGLPSGVVSFQWRARQLAWRRGDHFTFTAATRPGDLRILLDAAQDCRHVVELGTATGWTAIALAIADPERSVVSYDAVDWGPQRYLELVRADVSARIELLLVPGSTGPRSDVPVDLLYIDSSHERDQTIAEFRAWQPVLRPGAQVLFDDYLHSEYDGVREAVAELGLTGEQRGKLFIHRHRANAES
jgi:hypothetical protein